MDRDERDEIALALLGNRLRDVRAGLGLTLRDVHERCGVSAGALSDLERGRVVELPRLGLLLRLADAYECTVEDLLRDLYPFDAVRRPRRVPGPPPDGRRIRRN